MDWRQNHHGQGKAMAQAAEAPSGTERGYRIASLNGEPAGLPLLIEPGESKDVGRLCAWLRASADWVQGRLVAQGAMLFRGFAGDGPPDFERLARAIDDDLKNEYLGTSPRAGLTDFVFTASELPPYYPIPQHCDMSFVAEPPTRRR
jgi:hypothetical protein